MESDNSVIEQLKEEIETRNKELFTAATYGKQLLEENNILKSKVDELTSKVELLKQEKHKLKSELDTQNQTVKTQSNDLEIQRERTESLSERYEASEKEKQLLQKKNESLMNEIRYAKKEQNDLSIENISLKEKINLLNKQINNFENQAEKSLCEAEKDETQDLQTQLSTYMLNNKELQDALSKCQYELETSKKNEKSLMQLVKELEETVLEKNSEISAFCEEIKKNKEEMEELQGEIEVLKFDQIDVKKRGNSVFAELDDRRTLVEKEFKILRKKYEQFQKHYEENKIELDQARGQMAILQSMVSRGYQQSYIDDLEDALASARQEIRDLTLKLSKAEKVTFEKNPIEKPSNEYDYLRVMLQNSQKNEKKLQDEIMILRSKNMDNENKLIKTQSILYKTKEDLHSAEQEILKLKNKIKELELGIMHKLPIELPTQVPKIEVIEGFNPPSTVSEKTELLNKSIFNDFPDLDMIPGEIELGEDGFQQIKPPRKSNKFVLQEFNKMDADENKKENSIFPVPSANETGITAEKKISNVADKSMSVTRGRSKHSKNRYENCAQQ